MSKLLCKCGEGMSKSDCPSPNSLYIFYKDEVDSAIQHDPNIALHSFLSGWDDNKHCHRTYSLRKEPVDYWYCTECKRIYEVQLIPGGRWLRVFNRIDVAVKDDYSKWKRIYVLTDCDTDAATEENYDIRLVDYLNRHDSIHFYLAHDEKNACALDVATGTVLYSYELEESWTSPES